ncbi:DUF3097 domain-containing protein [Protaetiibacter intestinalis]|uniref:DUF3097 domain-containing protein n=1 Tax=Protaetiibacter intestinalis TaxID=2419774 RepID=A0A387BJC0_9MICO|nr:DUF3097 domain-containing protein [Protaetiibacter intestinalis]AYF98620.1 DUF3097 domain-containing protein [Protaetiibacter intestinalis]
MNDRYGEDVLAGDWRARGRKVVPQLAAERGLVVELPDGFVGAVVGVEKGNVGLEDRGGRVRWFPLGGGFLVDGEAAVLTVPKAAAPGRAYTASGSRAAPAQRARVARASRIYVEGRHDAELVEKVWGADLRAEGVVVEFLAGVDHLPAALAEVGPDATRRIGVLVDHLVPGSKEARIAQQVQGPHVLVVGHPYIDVWQAVRPERLGVLEWPVIPRGVEWKHGVCEALGWPHADQADIAAAWQRILGRVRGYTDLEPSLLGRVEQLIDFVTASDQ